MMRRQLQTLLLLFLCEICTNAALGETSPRFPPQTNLRCAGEVDAKAWLCSAHEGHGLAQRGRGEALGLGKQRVVHRGSPVPPRRHS